MSGYNDDYVVVSHEQPGGTCSALPHDDLNAIRNWLDPSDYDDGTSEYVKHLRSHLGGTGDWIEETQEYQNWHSAGDTGSNVLWIKAIAGAGKSVIAARTRARLSRKERIPVLHFFFRHIIARNRTPKQLLRDWLAQLLPFSPILQHKLNDEVMKEELELDLVSFDTLWGYLRHAAATFSRIYCFADALDEMSLGNDIFLGKLLALGDIECCRVFVTSRPMPHVVASFRDCALPPLCISLGPDNMTEDISRYVDHRLEHDISRYIDHRLADSGVAFPDADGDGPTFLVVRETLKSKAQGSFLYARLMTDNLLSALQQQGDKINRQPLRDKLDNLPAGLGNMYASILRDHAARTNTPGDLQFSILQWVTHSERPLRLLELATIIDFETKSPHSSIATKSQIRKACGPLLEILPSDVVGPVHHSFTEFLVRKQDSLDSPPEDRQYHIDSLSAHHTMTRSCLSYLNAIDLQEAQYLTVVEDVTLPDMERIALYYPFAVYAASHWTMHFRKAAVVDVEIFGMIDLLMDGIIGNEIRKQLSQMHSGPAAETATALHVAAALGLVEYVNYLIASGHDIEVMDENNRTPIFYASGHGWPEVVSRMLKLEADGNFADSDGYTPLHEAASRNNAEVAKVLLNHGIDPWTPKTHSNRGRSCVPDRSQGNPPLAYACSADHVVTLRTFVPFLNTAQLTEALDYAFLEARRRQPDYSAIRLLVEADALNVNEPFRGATPLYWAAGTRDFVVMATLLRRGASAASKSKTWSDNMVVRGTKINYKPTLPIHAFCSNETRGVLGDFEVRRGLELLLAAGNDIDATDGSGYAPLHYAQTSWQTSKLLLELGANMDAILKEDYTPLHRIANVAKESGTRGFNGENVTAVASGWLSNGVDINARTAQGETALMLLCRGHLDSLHNIFEFLLKQKPDLEVANAHGYTALHLCLENYVPQFGARPIEPIIRSLLEAGANPNARTLSGDTVLHLCHDARALKVLVEGGADVEAKNVLGATVLLKRAARPSCVRELLRLGSRVDSRDSNGETCLHYLVFREGYPKRQMEHSEALQTSEALEAFDLFLDRGADPTWLDANRNSVWHCAASSSSRLCTRLRDLNKDHDRPNTYGQTPFFVSVAVANRTFAEFLKSNEMMFDVNCRDSFGRAPIHLAACISEDMVRWLLELGADIRTQAINGWTALHFAAQARLPNVVLYLLELAPYAMQDLVHVQDASGRTALDIAARSGVSETVDILIGARIPWSGRECAAAISYCLGFPEEDQRWDQAIEESEKAPADSSRMTFAQEAEMLGMENPDDMVIKVFTAFHYRRLGVMETERITLVKIRQYLKKLIDICCVADPESLKGLQVNPEANSEAETWQGFRQMVHEMLVTFGGTCDEENTLSFQGPNSDAEYKRSKSVVQTSKKKRLQTLRKLKSENWLTTRAYGKNSADLIPQIYDSETELWGFPAAFQHAHRLVPNMLVAEGAYAALGEIGVKFKHQRARHTWTERMLQRVSDCRLNYIKTFDIMPGCWDVILLQACRHQFMSLETVKVLLEHFPISPHGLTLAVFALAERTEACHIQALRILLKHGADPMARDEQGRTALHMAHRGYRFSGLSILAVEALVQHGADPNVLDFSDASCLAPDNELVTLLVKYGLELHSRGRPILLGAVRANHVSVVKTLIEARVPLNLCAPIEDVPGVDRIAVKPEDSHPLYTSVSLNNDRSEVQRLLLDSGSDPHVLLANERPLVHHLVDLYGPTRAKTLLDYSGLDLSQRDPEGRTLLLVVANSLGRSHYPESYQYLFDLISRGAAVDAKDNHGKTVLHLLQGRWLYEQGPSLPSDNLLVELCREHGLINAVDDDHMAPIHHCLGRQHWKCAASLVSHGADYKCPDPDGNNAFHHFARGMITEPWCIFKDISTMRKEAEERIARKVSSIEDDQTRKRYVDEEQDVILQDYWRQEEACITALSETLQKTGVSIHLKNKIGEPPIFTFMRSCHDVCTPHKYGCGEDTINAKQAVLVARLNLLIRAGADLHAKSANGQNVLHALATCKSQESRWHEWQAEEDMPIRFMWQHLVAKGIDPYLEDDEQRTALDIAAIHGNTIILELY